MTQELRQNLETISNLDSNDSPPRLEFDLEASKFEFPLSKVRAGKLLEISDRTVGNWLKKLEEIHQPIGNAGLMTSSKGQITEWGFHCLQRFQLEKEDGYRDRVWSEADIEAPTEPGGALAVVDSLDGSTPNVLEAELVPVELPDIDVAIAEFLPDASRVSAETLQDTAEKDLEATQKYLAVTQHRYSQSRAIRRRNLIGQAVRDAAEDVRIYNQAYDATVSKALNDQTQGFDAQ